MLQVGALLTLLAVATQSVGKVLYGTLLADVVTQWFVLISISLTAAVFLASVQLHAPRQGRWLMVGANVWTAVSFIGLFFALKHLPPAMFASLEIGVALLAAVAITAVQQMAWPPLLRMIACAGILLGCALLAWTEIVFTMTAPSSTAVWIAIGAAMITGLTSALTVTTCRRLALLGWSPRAVLAHRFYLTILAAAAWMALEMPAISAPPMGDLVSIAAVGAVAVLLPLLLFQLALRRVDELTVMICGSAQPMISFVIALPSPAYGWDPVAFVGVVVVTLFVGLDIAALQRRAVA
jgi:drug/metabolite transporter (DMT)-like permease